ncbi:hypothetical protein ACWCQD_44730, partial [Streptomyces atratus]
AHHGLTTGPKRKPTTPRRAIRHSHTQQRDSALSVLTAIEAPEELAAALVEGQGAGGASRWTSRNGVRVDDGAYSYRNPSNGFALTPEDLARVSTAFMP